MENLKFRLLRADEIDCRVSTCRENGVSLLLYKDARVDQNILDETIGPMNWMRAHTRDNANCIVSIWDDEKKQWVSKEDTGTESNTEAEKGLASDSFKRACFNWGIGRELYTAPFIWIQSAACKQLKQGQSGKWQCFDRFHVDAIEYTDRREISYLKISNASGPVYESGHKTGNPEPQKAPECVLCADCGKQINPLKRTDGSIWAVPDIVTYGTLRFKRPLCGACMKKAQKAEESKA